MWSPASRLRQQGHACIMLLVFWCKRPHLTWVQAFTGQVQSTAYGPGDALAPWQQRTRFSVVTDTLDGGAAGPWGEMRQGGGLGALSQQGAATMTVAAGLALQVAFMVPFPAKTSDDEQ